MLKGVEDQKMWKYILKRLLLLIPVVLGVTFLVFGIMNLKPGDPGRMVLGVDATEEAISAYNEKLGLNKPFLVRYFDFINSAIHGDFGTSWYSQEPVLDDMIVLFPVTIRMCILAILFSILIGLPLGVYSAVHQYSLGDRIVSVFAMALASMPSFWLSLMLALLFSSKLKLLPNFGLESWKHYIMPLIVLGGNTTAMNIRMTRSSMLEEIRQDYVRTARAKGAKESTVIFIHALRNSLIPVLTSAGITLGVLLGVTVYVESVFAIPGIGRYLVNAVKTKDVPIVMACVVVFAVFVVVINLLVDLLYALLDPRIKAMYVGKSKKKQKISPNEVKANA